ncbi:MAG: fimbrillin family protein [Dysgonamonadaceae bacterium]|jgi:uncharacterized protein (TIGR02145 family)|nr:fimbrillin family protein [Dysgonamonadaceae bacterium]
MNIKYFITTLLIATTLVACSDIDEVDNSNLRNEVKIFASITERDADDPQSRANLDGTGAGTIGNGKAIRLNYTNGTSSGSMVYTFGETTLYWDDLIAEIGNPPFSFTAYYPVVPADISATGFNVVTALDPDLLAAHISSVNDGQNVNLVFNHIMHKLVVNLTSSQGTFDATQLANATVTLQNLRSTAAINANGTVNINGASGNDAYPFKRGANNSFIVAPQTFTTGTEILEIMLGGKTFTYKVPATLTELQIGRTLTLNLDMNEREEEVGIVINGIRWATRNVDRPGRFAATPEDPGMFYQWNRRIGWSSADPLVNSDGGTVWNTTIPTGTIWEKANDPCPKGWRVPTESELRSLYNIGGTLILKDRSYWLLGTAPNQILLPFAGSRRIDGALNGEGWTAIYWTNAQGSNNVFLPSSEYGRALVFWEDDQGYTDNLVRRLAASVRCVAE